MFTPAVNDPVSYTPRSGNPRPYICVRAPYESTQYGAPQLVVDVAESISLEDGNVTYHTYLVGYRLSDTPMPGRVSPAI